MARVVLHGATIRCDQGAAPSSLAVAPTAATFGEDRPIATTDDHQPMANVAPFGMCRSPANPQVAAATSAAMGVLTPQPCAPVIPAPWTPGEPLVVVDGKSLLTAGARCACAWGGAITIDDPAAAAVEGG